jgi:uncharacterized lipoprotein YmbA
MRKKMMKNDAIQLSLVLLSALLMVLSACTGTTKPSNFYVLSPLPESEVAVKGVGDENALAIGIGPITLPIYLDRAQIVTRISRNELEVDEFNRWAEPLKENFFRVLAENLSVLLNTIDVSIYPRRILTPVNNQVAIDVTRFDVTSDGQALLIAYWAILGQDGRKILLKKKSILRADTASRDYKDIVAAQNQVLSELSRAIAAEIKKLQ